MRNFFRWLLCFVIGHRWVVMAKPHAEGTFAGFPGARMCEKCNLWKKITVEEWRRYLESQESDGKLVG